MRNVVEEGEAYQSVNVVITVRALTPFVNTAFFSYINALKGG